MPNGISRESFEHMEVGSKLNVLFDYMKENYRCSCDTADKLEALQSRFDKRKKFDTATSGFFGLLGGATVMLFKGLFGR